MNTSCSDTVKCRVDAGKSPIFRSPCTYIYVQESQRFWDFVRIYTYERVKNKMCNMLRLRRFFCDISRSISMMVNSSVDIMP